MRDSLVRGRPKTDVLSFVASTLGQIRPASILVPRADGFHLAVAAKAAGTKLIVAADPTLYGTVLGQYLAGNELPSIQPTPDYAFLYPYMTDPVSTVAAVGLGLRLLQLRRKKRSLFYDERIRELRERSDVYIQQLRQAAEKLKSKVAEPHGSFQFLSVPSYDAIGTVDQTDCIVMKPAIKRDVIKNVSEAFEWDEPYVLEDMEYDVERLAELCANRGRSILLVETPVANALDPARVLGPPWQSLFAAKPPDGKTAKMDWVISNFAPEAEILKRSDVEQPAVGIYKLFTSGEIPEAADLRVVKESKEVVSYYRDLLVHRLAMVNAERYKIILLDGQLIACVGAHLQNLRASGVLQGVVKMTFCFTPEHPLYPRLHKLALMCVVSDWFWSDEVSDIEPLPRAVQTTMLTPYPEVKTARGIFELKGREWDTDKKQNKLTYYANLVHRTPAETLAEWRQRWGRRE